jgi:hypothetical protein
MFEISGFGFRVEVFQGQRLGVQGSRVYRFWGLRFKVQGSRFRV